MTEIEKTEGEIKVLQAKLELLKEMEKHKTPIEEAFKRIYGYYPGVCERSVWIAFQKGYEAAQKDYKVGEYQPTPQELEMTLEKSGEFSIVSYNGETYYRNLYDGICGGWYKTDTDGEVFYLVEDETERKMEKLYQEQVVVKEPEKEQKWDVVRESVKWCEEHRDESVEDYLKPHTPEKTEQLLREAFQKVQQTEEWKETQRKIDEEDSDKNFKNSLDLIKEWGEKNKPPTLYEILMDWWINHLDMEQSDEEIVDGLVDMIDKKFIPPSSDRNGYEWERGMKMIRDKLR